jgi:diadenylate cyclase
MLEFLQNARKPAIEIVIISSLYYMVFLFIRGTRAAQVVNGLLVFVIIYFIANFIGLQTLQWILSKIFAVAIIAFIVIFNPELRQGLANLGKRKFFVSASPQQKMVRDIVTSVFGLSSKKIGALIAIERKIGLGDYIDTGVIIDAELKPEIIQTIFMPNTPLHDGGIIVSKNILRAAGCIFPLTNKPLSIKSLGTRHRAAIGLSEETDAFIIVVSEETGAISTASSGRLVHNISEPRLIEILTDILVPKKATSGWRFWRHR